MEQSEVRATDERVKLTLSAGTATLLAGENPRDLFRRADEALYRAKSDERNRAVQSASDQG